MSIQATWGEAEDQTADLATNSGWSDFGAWADEIDPVTYAPVVRLWEHGYVRDVRGLVTRLALALKDDPPDEPTVKATAENLLAIARKAAEAGADHLAVTDGLGSEEGEDETDEEAAEFS